MSKFEKLAAINKIANECLEDGDYALASKFHSEFMKVAQIIKNETNTYRANGKNMQNAISFIQSNLGLGADGLFGPQTVYAIVKALDGIAPEPTLQKDYVQRAREFVQAMPAGFVSKLKNFVGMKQAIRDLESVPATNAGFIEPSDVKMRLIEALGNYRG